MEIVIKDNGNNKKLKDLVNIGVWMDQYFLVIGKMISKMEMENKFGNKIQNIKDNI